MPNEPTTYISPNFLADKLDTAGTEDLIDVLEDRMRYWLFEPATVLFKSRHGQIASFALLLSYFEGIWIYIAGEDSKSKSRAFFTQAFVEVFRSSSREESALENIATTLYKDARCGFFHDAMFRDRIYLCVIPDGAPLQVTVPRKGGVVQETGEIQTILVNPAEFYRYIAGHFSNYIGRLRDPAEIDLRAKFLSACQLKWGLGTDPNVTVLPPGW